jgi:hypothetical protein
LPLLAVDEVVPVAAEQDVGPVAAEIVSFPAPPSTVSLDERARFPVAENRVVPPLALTTSFSLVANVDAERGRVDPVEPHAGCLWRWR